MTARPSHLTVVPSLPDVVVWLDARIEAVLEESLGDAS